MNRKLRKRNAWKLIICLVLTGLVWPATARDGADFQSAMRVSGKISDEAGQPLPGANVLVKGTSIGTTSDASGEFALNLMDGNAVLVFSFIGYTSQEVSVNNQSVINISLAPDILSLAEVVVTGYGTQS